MMVAQQRDEVQGPDSECECEAAGINPTAAALVPKRSHLRVPQDGSNDDNTS